MYSESQTLDTTLDLGDDGKGTYSVQRRRNESTKTNIVARWHTTIYVRRTSLHLHAKITYIYSDNGNRIGNNRCPISTVTRHKRAAGCNHNYNASVDNDLIVATTNPAVTAIESTVVSSGFSVAIITAVGADEHLVLMNHTFLHTIPSVNPSVLFGSRHAAHTAIYATYTGVQLLYKPTLGNPSSSIHYRRDGKREPSVHHLRHRK